MKILFSFLLIILSLNSFGQFTNSKTQSIYGGLGQEDGLGSVGLIRLLTLDDGYLLCGYTLSGIGGNKTSPSKGKRDIWLVRLDSIGNILWDKTIGSTEEDNTRYDIVESQGNFFISMRVWGIGVSGDKSIASDGVWLIKLDNNGNKIWDKAYPVNGAGDAGILNLGTSLLLGCPYWLKKIDLNGNLIFDSVYDQFIAANNGAKLLYDKKNVFFMCRRCK